MSDNETIAPDRGCAGRPYSEQPSIAAAQPPPPPPAEGTTPQRCLAADWIFNQCDLLMGHAGPHEVRRGGSFSQWAGTRYTPESAPWSPPAEPTRETPLPLSTLEQAIREAVTEAFGPEFQPSVRDILVRALIEKLAPRTAGGTATGWQPIDDYHRPAEGHDVVLVARDDEPWVTAAYQTERDGWLPEGDVDDGSPGSGQYLYPTHFRRLPAPPAGASESAT